MAQNMEDWLARFAAEIGTTPPTSEELDMLLELAGIAAHASERPAAPITCWLVGRAGLSARDALATGQRLAGDSTDERQLTPATGRPPPGRVVAAVCSLGVLTAACDGGC